MNKESLEVLANQIIYEKPKIYDYILKKVNNKINLSFTSFFYKNQCYCPKCKKVVYGVKKNKSVPPVVVWCSNCGKKIKVDNLSSRIKKEKIKRFIFDVLEIRSSCLVNQTYCLTHYYNFKNGVMDFKESLFKLGCEVYDLTTGNKKIKQINTYSSGFGARYIFPFADAYAKNVSNPFWKQEIYYHPKYEDINYFQMLLLTNSVKKHFFSYFDIKDISISFENNAEIIPFIRCLSIYPKLETLYKLENYTWSDHRSDFFDSVLHCLKRKKGYEKYNYHLFRDIYTSYGKFDFNYYSVNIKLGKPYINDKNLIDYLWRHKKYIKRDIVNYLSEQPFMLYDDYIDMAINFNLNLKDKRVLYPKKLKDAHDDLVLRLESKQVKENAVKFLNLKQNYSLLEFEENGYLFSLPSTTLDFKTRGKILRQCLFSANYDKRYLNNGCIIVFIDSSDKKLTGKFTLELNKKLSIVQLHGFSNDINASKEQLDRLVEVRSIIEKRLSLLEKKKGKIVYKKLLNSNIIEVKNGTQVQM